MKGSGRPFGRPAAVLAAGVLLGFWAGQAAAQVTADDVVCSRCVDTGDIASGAVTSGKLQNGAVTKNKIANGAVKSRHIGPGQVTGGKLADAAVTEAKLAEDAVFGRILVVRNDPADPVGNCDELQGILADITDNDADNRYLIHLEPGVYDCGASTVQMKPFVDIAGSGRDTTRLRGSVDSNSLGVVTGADNAELRALAVEHTGGVANAVSAISTGDTNARLTDLLAVAENAAGGATGVQVRGTSVLTDVTASADNTGAPSAFSTNGVFVFVGAPTLVNVNASASGGSDAWGLQQSSSVTTARNSSFAGGGTTAVRASGTINLVSSQVDGLVSLLSGGIAHCVGTYDGAFNPLDGACAPIP